MIYLADRWLCSTELLDYINSLGHTYCVRLKGNIHVYRDGKKFKAKKLKHRKHHAVVHKDVYITDKRFKTNIVYSTSLDTSTPWIIATNKNIETTVQNYNFKFGFLKILSVIKMLKLLLIKLILLMVRESKKELCLCLIQVLLYSKLLLILTIISAYL